MSEEKPISEQLRQAREQQQKSIEEIHRQTGVSLKVLEGLEEGDFEVVEAVFIRMGLRSYAEHLGLDAARILQEYDSSFGSAHEPVPEPEPPTPAPAWPLNIPTRTLLFGLAAVGLVVVVLLVIALGDDESSPSAQVEEKTRAPAEDFAPTRAESPPSRPQFFRDQEPQRNARTTPPAVIVQDRPEPLQAQPQEAETAPAQAEVEALPQEDGRAPDQSEPRPVAAEPVDQPQPDDPQTPPDQPDATGEDTITATEPADQPQPDDPVQLDTTGPEDTITATEPADQPQPDDPQTPPDQPPLSSTEDMIAAAENVDQPQPDDPDAVPVAAEEAPAALAVPSPPTAASDDSLLTLKIEAIDTVWVQIEGDERLVFEGTVTPGYLSPDWKVHSYFQLTSGKPHGLRFWFQGQLLGERGRLGDPNMVLHFRASREGVILLDHNLKPLAPVPQAQTTTPTDSLP